jgi:hypothetical protein
MLKVELRFWGIDEKLFKQRPETRLDQIEELFDRPVHEIFDKTEGSDFFFQHINSKRIDFRIAFQQLRKKYDDDFKVQSISEVVNLTAGFNE